MNIERVINLLASGIKPAQVASILGVTPARISQLASEIPNLKELIAEKEAELAEKDIETVALDAKYHTAEHALINQVVELAPIAELRDVTAALRVISERQDKRKQLVNPNPVGGTITLNQVISLSLPNHALPEISLSSEKEVISINNRTLAPMSSTGVTNLFNTLDNKEERTFDHVPTTIPSSTKETPREAIRQEAEAQLALLF